MSGYYIPIKRHVSLLIPSDVFSIDYEALDQVWIKPSLGRATEESIEFETVLLFETPVTIQFPAFEGISLMVGGDGLSVEVPLSGTLYPELALSIGPVLTSVNIKNDYLRPARPIIDSQGATSVTKYEVIPDAALKIELGSICLSTDLDGNVSFDYSTQLSLPPAMIGDSGVVVEARKIIPILTKNRPNAIPSSIPQHWRGIYLDDATIYLPSDINVALPSEIHLDDFFIGSGGFCGKITGGPWNSQLNAEGTAFTGNGAGDIFGISFALKEIAIEFRQNTLVSSKIEGALILPFFEQPVICEVRLTNDGDFTVALSAAQTLPSGIPDPTRTDDGLFVFTKQDILQLKLKSIAFEKSDEVLSVKLGGDIKPLLGADQGLEWPWFEIKEMSIDSEGRVAIDGGWIDLPKQLSMDFYGFALEVSKIGFGSEDDRSNWIGFSGGLKLCEGLPMSGAVEGLRIYWKGETFWLEFQGAELAFEIPNSIAFEGRVALIEDGPKRGFKGGGKLKIIPSGLEINAEVVIGKNDEDPAYTYFFIFIDTQLPAGIPLFSTGVSLYGLAGLFAYNKEPKKTSQIEWYEGWYKGPPEIGVSSGDKWKPKRGSFALGAGVTLGTAPDNGYAVNAKTLLVLVLPGPILLIEGTAAFLKERAENDSEMFRALAVMDSRAGEFLLNIEAQYPDPPDSLVAELIHVSAGAEAFFDFNNPFNWHLFIGQKDPHAKRIRAEILSLFEANAYFMLFATRFEVGAWVGYDARWEFGPVKVKLAAWMEGNALVSWIPIQFKGDLTLFGEVGIKAFGVGLGLSVGAGVSVTVPIDYRIFAEFFININLPWPLPDLKERIELDWKKDILPPTPIPLGTIGIEHLKVSEKWLLERYPEYITKEKGLWDKDASENKPLESPGPIVPLDAKVVLSFVRSVVDAAKIGLNPSGVVAPERVGDYEFQYRLINVTLERRPKTAERRPKTASCDTWETVASRSADNPDVDKEKLWGSWLALNGDTPTTDSSEIPPMSKLMIFGKSPFEYARETIDDAYYDNFAEWNPSYGMSVVFPPQKICFDFDDVFIKMKEGEKRTSEIRRGDVIIIGENLRVFPSSEYSPSFLEIGRETQLATMIIFPENIRQVQLTVGKSESDSTCLYYNGAQKVGEQDISNIGSDTKVITFPEEMLQDFNILVLRANTELFRICYITAEEADRFAEEKETANHSNYAMSATSEFKEMLESELFLPNSYYRIEATTEVKRRKGRHGSWETAKRFVDYSYFQTADPPGILESSGEGEMTPTGEDEHYPERGPLKDLSQYVSKKYASKKYVSKTVPAEGTQAVYRSYDVGVEFNESYVETMYMLAGKPLAIYLYDNNGQGLIPLELSVSSSSWQENTEQETRRADEEWAVTTQRTENRRKEFFDAAQITAEEVEHPAAFSTVARVDLSLLPKQEGLWGGGEDFVLKPSTLYRAAVVAMSPQVVIPLDTEGKPILVNGRIQYKQIASDGSNFIPAIESTYGQPEPGMKVVSDGERIIVTRYKAIDTAQPPLIDREFVKGIIKEVLEPTEPKPEPKSVFSWSFITSRFTSFIHHIHSFVDAAWNLRATLREASWSELSEEKKTELRNLIEAVHPNRKELYQESIKLFALGDHPLPERLEIQVLEDTNGRYGFMIESPEPIQWRVEGKGRVKLDVRKSEHKMESPVPAYGPVKFINCNLHADWIDILVQTDLDLSGYKIERIHEEASAGIYYEFGENSQFHAGTVIRIHTHSPPPNYSPDVERKDIFIETDADILTNEGEIFRISDAEGRQIHQRQFASREFEELQAVIAPDVDGTRTFIFLRDNSREWISPPDGTYRFEWTFMRDAGNDLPTLRRRGSTGREEVTLEFNLPAELP